MNENELLKRLAFLKKSPNLAKPLTPEELADLVLVVLGYMKNVKQVVEGGILRGADGKDGYSPLPDVDYLSLETANREIGNIVNEAIKSLRSDVQKRLDSIKDGKDAVINDEHLAKAAEMAYAMIQIPDFGSIITQEPQAIRNSLELLQGDERLSISAIDGLTEVIEELKKNPKVIQQGGVGGIRFLSQLVDVRTTNLQNNDVLKWNSTTLQWENGAGGSGSVSDTAYGASWDGDTTTAPSKNAVYDKIESLTLGSGTGDFVGPASSTDNAVVRFDGTTGKAGQNSIISISDTGVLAPATSDTGVLGSGTLMWSDLFLASGSVINFNNGDVTITHSSNQLDVAGFSNLYFNGQVFVNSTLQLGQSGDSHYYIQKSNDDTRISTFDDIFFRVNGGDRMVMDTASLHPNTTDTMSLGTSLLNWSDLFLDSGAVINFDSGNATLTHSASLITSSVNIAVPDDAYAVGWNGSANVPTKNAVYDKIESLQPLDATLTSLAAYNTNGLLTQTAADTFTGRTLTAGSAKLSVTNGNGVSGNPTVDLGTVNIDDLADVTITAASNGQVLKYNGSAWVNDTDSTGGGGGISWSEVTGTTQTAAVNTGYIANNAAQVVVTLPTTAAVGDVVRVSGKGAGGWRIAQNASEIIHFGSSDTTTGTGGYIESTHRRDAVELVCCVADTEWNVISSVGNLTVV